MLKIYHKNNTEEVVNDSLYMELALNQSDYFYLRYSDGQTNAVAFTINAPFGTQVSKDNISFSQSISYAKGEIEDIDVPFYIKRTLGEIAEPQVHFGTFTPRLHEITAEEKPDRISPVINGELSSIASPFKVSLDGLTATDNKAISTWEYNIDNTNWIAFNTLPLDIEGLAPDTLYTISIRVKDTSGNTSQTVTKQVRTSVAPVEEQYLLDDIYYVSPTRVTTTGTDPIIEAPKPIGIAVPENFRMQVGTAGEWSSPSGPYPGGSSVTQYPVDSNMLRIYFSDNEQDALIVPLGGKIPQGKTVYFSASPVETDYDDCRVILGGNATYLRIS